jgi:hydroxyacylglutathione hydrolase
MKGRIGDALVDLGCDLLDVTLALGEHVDDFGPPTVAERLGDVGETVEQRLLGDPITHYDSFLKDPLDKLRPPVELFKRIFEEWGWCAWVSMSSSTRASVTRRIWWIWAMVRPRWSTPPRFPLAHEQLAERLGVRLAWTLDTHSHADYVTGSPTLAAGTDAVFVAPAASRLTTPHRPVGDNDEVALADSVTLEALATPGHTPDHHAYLLQRDREPVALFTGGSLMVGTVGRTDLCGVEQTEPLAHQMFHSLRRFDDLPDDLAVYPTHGAGSFCSAPGASERTTTLGRERATNSLFAVTDEDQFVARLIAGFGTFPTYFVRLPELNRLGPRRYDGLPSIQRLSADDVEGHRAAGGVVVDARPTAAFAAGHIPRSIANTLRPPFGSWLGWLVELDRPVVFVLDDEQDRDELVRQCLDVGHENLVGELAGGIDAWRAAGRPVEMSDLVDPSGMTGQIIDVRQANEYTAGHVPGARNVELGSIPDSRLPDEPLTVMCGHGERAMTAASLLTGRGHTDVAVLDGGPDTWARATGCTLDTG